MVIKIIHICTVNLNRFSNPFTTFSVTRHYVKALPLFRIKIKHGHVPLVVQNSIPYAVFFHDYSNFFPLFLTINIWRTLLSRKALVA